MAESCYDCYYFKEKVRNDTVVCDRIWECYVGLRYDCKYFKPNKNVHKGCEHYVAENDMCLLFFQLNFHNVSQFHECLEKVIYDG